MAKQGYSFSETELQKIVGLLSKTEMAIPDIAERFACTPSAIVAVNRKFQVRNYCGRRTVWTVESDSSE